MTVSGAMAGEDWPMVCRGGGNMFVTATMFENNTAVVEVGFTRAPMGAGARQLLPGTCAWPDRPIRADEPAKLQLALLGAARLEVRCSRGNCDLVTNSQLDELFGVASVDTFFHLTVRNNGRGAFKVMRMGR